MLQVLRAQLSDITEQQRLKRKLESDLCAIKGELQNESNRLAALGTQLAKEKVDVERLEHTSLTGLFYSILGSREQQLEKERQELLGVELRYRQAEHQVAFLEQEENDILQQLKKLSNVESEYNALLSEKERLLRQSDQAAAKELIEFSERIAELNSTVKEINEAMNAGYNALQSLEQVIASLKSAEAWGLWDMFQGGLISTAIKHSRIDDARSGIHDVQAKMSRFTRELADVKRGIDIQLNIGEFATFADYIFDGLIADWVVQSKISGSLAQSERAKHMITRTIEELKYLKRTAENKRTELQEKQTRFIERA